MDATPTSAPSAGDDRRVPSRARRRRALRIAALLAVGIVAAGLGTADAQPVVAASDRLERPAATSDAVSAAAPASTTVPVSTTTTASSGGSEGSGSNEIPAALADADWYPKFAAENAYANTWFNMFKPAGYTKFSDGGIENMHIKDGHRQTWQPPACTCPKMTVWIYGSAAVLGLNQRDDFTMASMLSKLAWSKGISLEVVNKGVPGDQYWLQADRFAWDVSGSTPPDMVVFYTGVSDLNAAYSLNEQRLGDRDWPDDLFAATFLNDSVISGVVDKNLRGGKSQPPAPEGVRLVKPKPAAELDPAGIGRLATSRLGASLPMGLDIAKAYDVTPFVFWEPMRLSRDPLPGEPVLEGDADLRATERAAEASLPSGVINITHALDSSTKPLYFDDLHHNELGASMAAQAVYDHLALTIATLAQTRGG